MTERVLLGAPYTATETGPHALGIRHQHGMASWEVQATSDEEPGHYGFRLKACHVGPAAADQSRWARQAAQFVQYAIEQLEPGTLRSPADLPDEPPLFTTRRLFRALEARVERLERAPAPAAPRDDPYLGLSAAARVVAGPPKRVRTEPGQGSAGD